MAKIFKFPAKIPSGTQKALQAKDLTVFLRNAHSEVSGLPIWEKQEKISPAGFKRIVTAKMMDGLLKTRSISEESFLCGIYAAGILASSFNLMQESRWSIDYLEQYIKTGNPFFYQSAGDHLFRICAIFPESVNRLRRPLKLDDYRQIGAGCYQTFYHLTDREIGYHMSQNFYLIADIAHKYAVKSW